MNRMRDLYGPNTLPESAFSKDEELVRDCFVVICEEVSTDDSYLFYTDISRIGERIVTFCVKSDQVEEDGITCNYPCTVLLNRECGWFRQ